MEKKINLVDIYNSVVEKEFEGDEQAIRIYKATRAEVDLKAMKEACRQTLELAAENAALQRMSDYSSETFKSVSTGEDDFCVSQQSILDTIYEIG